jgi:hypothetical protein
MSMDSEQGKRWWYSLRTHAVEDDDGPTPGKDRLGPFPTREAAARALERVQERNSEWDAKD